LTDNNLQTPKDILEVTKLDSVQMDYSSNTIKSIPKGIIDKKQHKRTNTQYSFVNSQNHREKSSTRKTYNNNNSKEVIQSAQISTISSQVNSEGERVHTDNSKMSFESTTSRDCYNKFFALNTEELKKENEFRKQAKKAEEDAKKEGSRASFSSNNTNNSGKHMYLFYRTPSNKDGKKLHFSTESSPSQPDSKSNINTSTVV
jgi:hypothetical protein